MRAFSKVIFGCVFFLVQAFSVTIAQERSTDTLRLKVFFKRGESVIRSEYRDNRVRMAAFEDALKALEDVRPLSITITAGSSPDGNTQSNKILSEARAQALSDLLPSGRRNSLEGRLVNVGKYAYYWSSTAVDESSVKFYTDDPEMSGGLGRRSRGLSVRPIRMN